MLFNQTVLDNKTTYLDCILKSEALLRKILKDFSEPSGGEYEYEPVKRPWDPGGGSTLFAIRMGSQRFFLKVKSCKVLVESKLEKEDSFSDIPSLRNEYLWLQRVKDLSPNTPKFFRYAEEDGFAFLLLEHLSPFKNVVERLNAKELLEVYEQIEGTTRKLHEMGVVHTDIHENNIMFRGTIPVLVDFEEARTLCQQVPFEKSLDVAGENAWGNVGRMPQEDGAVPGYTCLNRLKKIFQHLMLPRLDELASQCNFDCSCPFLNALDHGQDERVYQSINVPGYSIEGQRPLCDKRIEFLIKVADRLFQKPFTHLDIGSNLGRFNIEISKCNKVKKSIGVEGYEKYVDLARILAFLSDCSKARFVRTECGRESLSGLLGEEDIDLVTVYSVYHHIVNKKAFIEDLALLEPSCVIFEMATQKECYGGKSWQEEIRLICRQMKMPYHYVLTQSADYNRPVVLLSRTDVSRRLFRTPETSPSFQADYVQKVPQAGPQVSMVLPTYNHLRFLPQAVGSVLSQSFTDFELIIVNDGSTDGTGAYLDTLKDPRVRVIHQANKHLPEALNAGFRAAHGDLLTWVSADNYCAPMFLERLVSALDANPNVGLVYSAFANIDEHDQITSQVHCPDMNYRRLLLQFQDTGMASFMYRRTCQEKVGFYDPALEGAEDWDMWLRIAEFFDTVYVPDILYYYRRHPDSLTKTASQRVFQAALRTFQNALNRLRLERLYPSLDKCEDQPTAQFHAFFDLATGILKTKFSAQTQGACKFLEKARSLRPDSLEVTSNLAVAYSRSGQWSAAVPLLRQMSNAQDPKVLRLCRRIIEAYNTGRPESLASADLFETDESSSELFQLEQQRKRGTSTAGHTVTRRVNPDDDTSIVPAYCAPEQLLAESPEPVTTQTLGGKCIEDMAVDDGSTPSENKPEHLPPGERAGCETPRILLYYDQLGNLNESSPAGTVIAMLNFARMLLRHTAGATIHLTGGDVTHHEGYESFQVVPQPRADEKNAFIRDYDTVFFATELKYFEGIAKRPGQRWVLYQHCWKVYPDVLARMDDLDAVICLSELHRSFLLDNGIQREKLVTIPNLIDISLYSPKVVSRNNHSIMYAGGLHPHKCVHILLQAFRLVREQISDAELHIYGNSRMWRGGDDYGSDLERVRREAVHFHGYIEHIDMPHIYSRHSILCLPSRLETFPLVPIEAQACGCIPVVHNVGGAAATLRDTETGFLYSPNTPEKLAETIMRAMAAAEACPAIRQKAMDFVRDNLSTTQAEKYLLRLKDKITNRAAVKAQPTDTKLRTDAPKISVILTTYNRQHLFAQVLRGFASQTARPEDFEVIVVDDGSQPPVKEIVEGFCNRIHIKYLYEQNAGLAVARNTAIRSASGHIVLFCDDDDVPDKHLISEHIRSHTENPDERIAVLGYRYWHPDLPVTPVMHHVIHVGGEYFGYDRMTDGQFYDHWKFWGGVTSLKMSLLRTTEGPFDSRLGFGYEDTELSCRLAARGLTVLYNARAKSFVLVPVDFEGFCKRRYKQGRAIYRLASLHPGLVMPRYNLQNAAELYYGKYAPFLEEWRAKVSKFEPLLTSKIRLHQPGMEKHLRSLYTVYHECFLGYWLKGYVDEKQAIESGRTSLSEPVNTQRAAVHDREIVCPQRSDLAEWNQLAELSTAEPLRITFVSPCTPGFDVGSSNLRIYHILKILVAGGHKIDYLYWYRYSDDERYKAAFDGAINFIKTQQTADSFSDYLHFNKVRPLDCVWITNLWDVDYLNYALQLTQRIKQNHPQTKVIIDTMDFHYKKYLRKFGVSRDQQDRLKAEHFLGVEKRLYPLADQVLTVTDVERRDILETIGSGCNVSVIPNIHKILPHEPNLSQRKNICFLGSFYVRHNADAAAWYLKEVFPLIVREAPEVEFHILGFGNEEHRAAFELHPNVKVIGYVEDAELAVANYRLFVCPMTYGAGMKGKLGTAAAAGTPFVTTLVGAEGFNFTDGQHCFIADDPKDFAHKCLRLLREDALWLQFSTRAKEMFAQSFSIKAVGKRIHALFGPVTAAARKDDVTADLVEAPACLQSAVSGQAGHTPKVTVITSCYNSERFLPECLDSILSQTMQAWELFLLDDGSTDGTRKIIEQYSRLDERIKPYYFQSSEGPYARRNFAIKRTSADFIVIQDADDIMSPAKLQILCNEIRKDEQLAVVGSFYRLFLDEFNGLQYTDSCEFPLEHDEIAANFSSWQHTMSQGSAIIRKRSFEQIGYYDENPFASGKFWFAKLAEYARHYTDIKFKNVPEYLTLIRVHANCQTQLLPVIDPRNRRMRYRQYCELKLRKMRQRLETCPNADVATELKNCVCSDFLESFKDHIVRWEGETLDETVLTNLLGTSVLSFNRSAYVSCIGILNGIEATVPEIAERFANYDLLRAMAFLALDMKKHSLMYLNREVENHRNAAAKQFISDYFEKHLKRDVQKWCAENADLYDLQMIDTRAVAQTA